MTLSQFNEIKNALSFLKLPDSDNNEISSEIFSFFSKAFSQKSPFRKIHLTKQN